MNFKTGQSPEYVENYVLLLNDAKAQKAQWNLVCSYYIFIFYIWNSIYCVVFFKKEQKTTIILTDKIAQWDVDIACYILMLSKCYLGC